MGRKSTFRDCDIFVAVSDQIAAGTEINIQTLSRDTKVSIGSLYHRYGSREALIAAAWLDALQAFQQRIVAALNAQDDGAGVRAALVTPEFSRSCRSQAIILTLGRRETLLNDAAPKEVQDSVDALNAASKAALEGFARRSGIGMQACSLGIFAYPLAAVRLFLPRAVVPAHVDDYVRAAYQSAVEVDGQRLKS